MKSWVSAIKVIFWANFHAGEILCLLVSVHYKTVTQRLSYVSVNMIRQVPEKLSTMYNKVFVIYHVRYRHAWLYFSEKLRTPAQINSFIFQIWKKNNNSEIKKKQKETSTVGCYIRSKNANSSKGPPCVHVIVVHLFPFET